MLRELKIILLTCLDGNTVFKYNLTIKYSIIIMQNVILAIVICFAKMIPHKVLV